MQSHSADAAQAFVGAVHASAQSVLLANGYDATAAMEVIPELYVDASVLERAGRPDWAGEAAEVGAGMAALVLGERRRTLLHQSLSRTHIEDRPELLEERQLPLPDTTRTAYHGAAGDRLAAAHAAAAAMQRQQW